MTTKVIVNPVTRISGYLQIEVEIENNVVVDAKSQGMMFRGFEKMLKGRVPSDAIYFTERICGICSTAHGLVSAKALENALSVSTSLNEKIIRDIMHSSEFIQNHLRHFYQFVLPDYVSNIGVDPVFASTHKDYRIPIGEEARLKEDYFLSIEVSKKAHQLLALLGGKAPHTHGIFVGGVTATINAEKILEAQGIVAEIIGFINSRMIKDVITIGKYYNDYFKIGQSHGNFMSYGLFESYDGGKYVPRKIILKDGQELDIDPNKITQNIYNAWYSSNNVEFNIANESWEANPKNPTGYSFIKAPRYDGMPMEVGPLARTYISGLYREGSSTMNRLMARVLEAKEIAEGIRRLLQKVKSEPPSYKKFIMPEEAFGFDLHDTTRGALAHFVGIKNKLIDRYTIITPSGWNLSPTDSKGIKGTIEQALIGSFIENPKDPIELGRIVRSFDPCVSCGTHVISNKTSLVEIRVV